MKIKVPWGIVAGQWHGSSENRPIVMLHGWQDNAGTFERLIPLLPSNQSYLAVDLPGHGFSSHIPHVMHYSLFHYIHTLNLIKRHYSWDKMSLIGHSMGGMISTLFAAMNQNQCDFLICIDGLVTPFSGNGAERARRLQKLAGSDFLDLVAKQQNSSTPKGFPFDDTAKRWSEQISIDIDSIKCLMKRGLAPLPHDPDRFHYTRDSRLKILDFGLDALPEPVFEVLAKQINIPHLFIKAAKARYYEQNDGKDSAIQIYQNGNKQFEWISINEGHHLHLTNPHSISTQLSSFINKCR